MNPVLTIDPEFEAKCPPLTEDELSQLEENILEEGLVLMPSLFTRRARRKRSCGA